MSKNKNKNASSFFQLCEIENGKVIQKIKLPSNSFTKFDPLKTDVFKTNMSDIFVLNSKVTDVLNMKIGRK
jgi:hypothetical protein